MQTQQVIRTSPVPTCDECGAQMVLRTNRSTQEKFWGCSQYPNCKFTLNIGFDGEPEYKDNEYYDDF